MSDFDVVLERLVTDPVFQAALRADPEAALRGYQLADDERRLLGAQLDLGSGADREVEDRVSKSGVFGLVGPVVSALGLAAVPPEGVGAFGVVKSPGDGGGPPAPLEAPGDAVGTFGDASGTGTFNVADVLPGAGTPAEDYETRVDAGRGQWEPYRAVERGDGGVDILVDRDGDGKADWVGHDFDRDGLLESGDYDSDGDGILDTRAVDVDGDGWFDRAHQFPTSDHGTFGVATPDPK